MEGIASTTSIDLDNDMVSQQAMESMKEHATKLNIHANHNTWDLFDGVIGHITEVLESDDKTLKIKFVILEKYAADIKAMLDLGIKLGLSIGGAPTSWKEQETPDGGFVWIIEDIILFEISLTALPANWDTFNTVTTSKGLVKSKCFAGACREIIKIKKNNGENMAEYIKKEGSEGSEGGSELTESKVVDMINEGLTKFKDEEFPSFKEEIKTEILDEIKQEEGSEGSEGGDGEEGSDKGLSTEELEKQIEANIEEKFFKKLGLEREPEGSTPGEEGESEVGEGEETQKTHNGIPVMSRKQVAKNLAESRGSSGLAAILQNIQE